MRLPAWTGSAHGVSDRADDHDAGILKGRERIGLIRSDDGGRAVTVGADPVAKNLGRR